VPEPQATVSGRRVWARPVAEEWAEQRYRSPEGITQALSAERDEPGSPDMRQVRTRLERTLMGALWEHPPYRRRWSLRWRSRDAVQEVARDLSQLVTADLHGGGFVSIPDLAVTVSHALLDELAHGRELGRGAQRTRRSTVSPTRWGRMLGWLIACDPLVARRVIGEVTGQAERRFKIPRQVTEHSLRTAIILPREAIAEDSLREFLDRVMSLQPQTRPPKKHS
jgi:hypothetical protein